MGISGRNLPSCLTNAEEIFDHFKGISIKHKLCDVLDKLTTMVIGSPCVNNMELTITTWAHIMVSDGHK